MDRRTLLKLLSAAAIAGCDSRGPSNRGLRVVVAGAGIVGASIAYHLSKSGAAVTVIDKLGPATHASRGTFAWINATWAKQPRHYHSLTQDSVASWGGLQRTLDLPIRWTGSLEWYETAERREKLTDQIAEQIEWGERAQMVDTSSLATLEPNVDFGAVQQAAYSANDGAVDPVLATKALLLAAEHSGATVRAPCELTGVALNAGRLTSVVTNSGTIKADRLVLATGAAPDTSERFADCVIPQRSTPGVIAITAPMPRLINRIIAAPGAHLHQRDDGRIVLGEQSGAPQNDAHALRLVDRPNDFPVRELANQHAARMLEAARRFVPGVADAVIEDVFIGWRPLPLDGHPVLGASPARPDVYLAIMHSGVSLAPIVGQLAAHELTAGITVERLGAYRPNRDFELIKRY